MWGSGKGLPRKDSFEHRQGGRAAVSQEWTWEECPPPGATVRRPEVKESGRGGVTGSSSSEKDSSSALRKMGAGEDVSRGEKQLHF